MKENYKIVMAVIITALFLVSVFMIYKEIKDYGESEYQRGANDTLIALDKYVRDYGQFQISQDYILVAQEVGGSGNK